MGNYSPIKLANLSKHFVDGPLYFILNVKEQMVSRRKSSQGDKTVTLDLTKIYIS